MLTIVELAVGLLAVDDVETIGNAGGHVADLKVKPLGVNGAVGVCIQDEVIFVSVSEGWRGWRTWREGKKGVCREDRTV